MGEVAVTYRVMPESIDVDIGFLKKIIKKNLPRDVELKIVEEKPVAFGLKALEVTVVMSDSAGNVDRIEEIFSRIRGVQSIEPIKMGRL